MDNFTFKMRYRVYQQPSWLIQSLIDNYIEEGARDVKEHLPAEIARLEGEGIAGSLATFNAFLGEWFVDDNHPTP